MNILLVDDDRTALQPLRNLLERHFSRRGIRVFYAKSLPDGLKEARDDSTIKLVLQDLTMPCVEGPRGAIPYIKKYPCNVAIYSAHDDPALIRECADNNAVAFISKKDSYEVQIEQIDAIVNQISAAQVRIKTERHEGFRIMPQTFRRWGLFGSGIGIGGLVALIIFIIGQAEGGLGHVIANAKRDALIDKKLVEHDKSFEHVENSQHRTELTLAKICQALGIQPARDGE